METLIAEFGLPIALVVYFIWREQKRGKEDREDKKALSGRLSAVEDYQKERLEGLAIASNEAIVSIHESHERLIESNDRVHTALLRRKCIAADVEDIRNAG